MYAQLYFDGASRGNPGCAAGAIVLWWGEDHVTTYGEYFGQNKTNNYAEYKALILGLRLALAHKINHLDVFGDSQLIIKQLNGEYRIRSKSLLPIFRCASQLIQQFEIITLKWICRCSNKLADRAVNEILDRFIKPKLPD